jgi:hypothetical protein
MPATHPATGTLRALLSGGDRRSIAQSNRARELLRSPERVAELAALTADTDPLVVMRAVDLLEKLAHDHPQWVQPHRKLFIGPLADSDRWEIRLQIVRALPLLTWTARERTRVIQILRRDVELPQKFVRAWALDSLAQFMSHDQALRASVERHLARFEHSGCKALATRAAHIRRRLAATEQQRIRLPGKTP